MYAQRTFMCIIDVAYYDRKIVFRKSVYFWFKLFQFEILSYTV